ncbi:MAG TPA: hypothetical protein VHK67_01025 [Rhabdochlamydiaceae bacterium]|jgi:hypothetical protein|nr:hypothetical protein [Rhabdochlamydiaceae bacterium]
MNGKQILGGILFVGGLGLLYMAHYINVQVEEGNLQILSGQRKVNQVNSLFNTTPATKGMGQGLTSGAQKQIDEGKNTIEYYTAVANRCQFGGIAALVVGAGMMFFFRKKKN